MFKMRVALRPVQRARSFAVIVLLSCLALMEPALAQQSLLPAQQGNPQLLRESREDVAQEEAAQNAATQNRISQKQALEIARANHAGNVISINEVRLRNGTVRYRIRMDNDGNIFTVFVDARTGAVSRE